MISLSTFLISTLLGFIFWHLLRKTKNRHNLPPGPFALPLVGNLLQMGQLPHKKLGEWVQTYGKMYTVGFGPYKCIMLNDAKLIKEAFNDANLGGRVDLESFHAFAGGKHGVISSDGPEWLEQRRFTLRNLRDFGFGKNTMENLINEEVREYLKFLKANEGRGVSVAQRFSLAVLNSLWMVLANKRYNHDDPRLLEIFEQNKKISEEISNSPSFMLPRLAKLFPKLSGYAKSVDFFESTMALSRSHIDEHKRTYSENEMPRDFIDVYLKEMKATKDPNSSFYKEAGDLSLLAVVQDMFFAGSDTTSNTLSWSVLYLSKFPETQRKLQAELDAVVGVNRRATLADRPSLIYTEAVVLETLRMSSIVPQGVFHTAMVDTKFHGYDIPKGTWITPNQHYLHHSKDIWNEPEIFRPERHLKADGTAIIRNEALMPFSTGKRMCLGSTLALDSFFLFLTAIFQKYQVRLAPGSENVSLESKIGFLLSPQDFQVIVKERLIH